MEIHNSDLQLTKKAFQKLYTAYHSAGASMAMSFVKIEELCKRIGYQNYYSSFTSFKTAFYREKQHHS